MLITYFNFRYRLYSVSQVAEILFFLSLITRWST
jgi:hypothetical protein